jgi:hypothetical protein
MDCTEATWDWHSYSSEYWVDSLLGCDAIILKDRCCNYGGTCITCIFSVKVWAKGSRIMWHRVMWTRAGAVGEAMGITGLRKVGFVNGGGGIGIKMDLDLWCFFSAVLPVMYVLDFPIYKAAIYGPPNLITPSPSFTYQCSPHTSLKIAGSSKHWHFCI